MEKIISKLINWNLGNKTPPLKIEIWPTMKCNLSCRFCRSNYNLSAKNELSLEEFSKIIKKCKEMDIQEILITGGGEPMMRKEVTLPIMREIKSLNINGFLITNGTLLKEKDIKEIIKIGWDFIMFSLDGPDSQINDYLRGKGVFEKVVKNIKTIQKVRSKTENPSIGINTVLTSANYKKAEDMVKLAHKLDCKTLIFQSLMVQSKEMEKLKMDKKMIKEFKSKIPNIKKLVKKYDIFSNIESFRKTEYIKKSNKAYEILLKEYENSEKIYSAPCFEPWINMLIKPNGKVGPCSNTAEKSPVNVKNQKLNEIWYGTYFEKIRNRMISGDFLDICKKCCTQKMIESKKIRRALKEKLNEQKVVQ